MMIRKWPACRGSGTDFLANAASLSHTSATHAPCVGTPARPPKWIKPQLTRLVEEAPLGVGWLREIKYDGYRMHAHRRRRGCAADSEQPGLAHRYHRTIEALGSLKVKSAYLDGELCALNSQGVPVLSRPQAAMAEHARAG
jgi:ATP-dependent DNA ligase